MKLFKLVPFAALIAVFAMGPSCSKYEEGPALSVIPKKSRLVGVWKLDKIVEEDGDEENIDNNNTYEFTKDNDYKVVQGNFTYDGEWTFTQDKEYLKLTYSAGGFSFSTENKILRLTNKELWLEEDGDQYQYVSIE